MMTPDQLAAAKATLEAAAEKAANATEALDDIVHDIKSEEASQINNQGPDEQISYILESMKDRKSVV